MPAEKQIKDQTITPTPEKAENAEKGGRKGPEPTRYGDWEKDGKCVDF
jgi:hypothetical protein